MHRLGNNGAIQTQTIRHPVTGDLIVVDTRGKGASESKYTPHQGKREIARRQRQSA